METGHSNSIVPMAAYACCTCNGIGIDSDGNTCRDCNGVGIDNHN